MATATFALTSPSEGMEWTISITNIDGAGQVKDISSYSSSAVNSSVPNLGSLFTIDSDNNAVNGYPGYYVTWRSTVLNMSHNQYPSTGFSFDIWSSDIYTDVITNSNTWNDLNNNTYTLNENKHSLIYNYDNYYAPVWSKGGTLTITIT